MIKNTEKGLIIHIRIVPNSSKNEIILEEEFVKLKITAQPVENNANKARIYKYGEMDADHVTAWSKGGSSSIKNCQMLCKTHNRAKGNR